VVVTVEVVVVMMMMVQPPSRPPPLPPHFSEGTSTAFVPRKFAPLLTLVLAILLKREGLDYPS
jgi:hypothetical protein